MGGLLFRALRGLRDRFDRANLAVCRDPRAVVAVWRALCALVAMIETWGSAAAERTRALAEQLDATPVPLPGRAPAEAPKARTLGDAYAVAVQRAVGMPVRPMLLDEAPADAGELLWALGGVQSDPSLRVALDRLAEELHGASEALAAASGSPGLSFWVGSLSVRLRVLREIHRRALAASVADPSAHASAAGEAIKDARLALADVRDALEALSRGGPRRQRDAGRLALGGALDSLARAEISVEALQAQPGAVLAQAAEPPAEEPPAEAIVRDVARLLVAEIRRGEHRIEGRIAQVLQALDALVAPHGDTIVERDHGFELIDLLRRVRDAGRQRRLEWLERLASGRQEGGA